MTMIGLFIWGLPIFGCCHTDIDFISTYCANTPITAAYVMLIVYIVLPLLFFFVGAPTLICYVCCCRDAGEQRTATGDAESFQFGQDRLDYLQDIRHPTANCPPSAPYIDNPQSFPTVNNNPSTG